MDVLVTVTNDRAAGGPEATASSPDEQASSDLLRDLRVWLSGEPQLRGRVRLVDGQGGDGALSGGLPEALQVVLGTGGALASLSTVVIAWLGTRKTGEITVAVSRSGDPAGDARVELSVKGVKGLDLAATRALTEHVTALLSDHGTPGRSEPAHPAEPDGPAGPGQAGTPGPGGRQGRGGDDSH
ncbi:effector-associated constant component EACC1 [Nonomuraea sediminis]|uniref:effector-associated constant component EACC1 n=1 Tax=Nonomuraea sediminis TaxID=2835864 RepID=UPI001BDC1C2A|nr:hypothetical protein [Nonomuraea sediminis]